MRGLVEELSDGTARRYARAFGEYLKDACGVADGARVLVGRDLRDSSPMLAADCWAGLGEAGLIPVDCDAVPTPALAAFAMARQLGAIMVTGSHIPADRNGLKFYRPDGEIDKDDESGIARRAAALGAPAGNAMPEGIEDWQESVIEAYRARYDGFMDGDALAGRRIGIYAHSAVGRDCLAAIVAGFGADVVILGHSNEFIPVDTEAVDPETVRLLEDWSQTHRLEAILSTDGDSDRPLLADAAGKPVRGDALGVIAARHLNADIVVTPVTSNSGIERALPARIHRTRVGSPYVIASMTEARADAGTNAVIVGFEANGGLLTASPVTVNGRTLAALPTRDAVLPLLCMLAEMAVTGRSIADLVAGLGLPVALSDRVPDYPQQKSATLMAELGTRDGARRITDGAGEIDRIETTDGVQVFFTDASMLHFRPSGNAPEMRCYAEAATEDRAATLLALGLERITSFEAHE